MSQAYLGKRGLRERWVTSVIRVRGRSLAFFFLRLGGTGSHVHVARLKRVSPEG